MTVRSKLPVGNNVNTIAARTRLRPAERRATIIEAAGRLFGERGYEATTLDDVAAAAGVTKPILYRHFDSKRDLYLALLERAPAPAHAAEAEAAREAEPEPAYSEAA